MANCGDNFTNCEIDDDVDGTFMLAKSYFDLGEYRRCVHALGGGFGTPLHFFLRCYALYLDGERQKEELMGETADPLEQNRVTNKKLAQLSTELERRHRKSKLYAVDGGSSGDGLDAYGLYLYGVVLNDMGRKAEALGIFCQSVNEEPLLWAAWLDLAAICTEAELVEDLPLSPHWARDFFLGHILLELQQNEAALRTYSRLAILFPLSTYLLAQRALAHYNMRNFDEAQQLYEALGRRDPHRLQGMDTYSNILYVKECRAELSYLAQNAVRNNKFSAEACCIVGNYYSMKACHAKAIRYFQRALRLNRRYLSAWTLMGHEFVEMKNISAAIEAYRKAVDISPRDYRAWYVKYDCVQVSTMTLTIPATCLGMVLDRHTKFCKCTSTRSTTIARRPHYAPTTLACGVPLPDAMRILIAPKKQCVATRVQKFTATARVLRQCALRNFMQGS